MAKQHQPIWLCGPEVKGDGSRLLTRPLVQSHKRLWGVKGHRVQRGYTLTLEGHHATHLQTWKDCVSIGPELLICCLEIRSEIKVGLKGRLYLRLCSLASATGGAEMKERAFCLAGAVEGAESAYLHLWVSLFGQSGQLQSYVIVLVDHL